MFLSSDARKFAARVTFVTICAFSMDTLPTATLRHMTFFIWNLMVALTPSIFSVRSAPPSIKVGNLPAFVRPGPNSLGICLMSVSDARNASNFFANFLMTFLFLLNFFKSSTDILSTPMRSASSQCTALPMMQHLRFGRGTTGSLKVPEKRLSRCGS